MNGAAEGFCPEISHAEALFGRAADPNVPYSVDALRRLGRTLPALGLDPRERLAPVGMRTTFDSGSAVRVEVFYEGERMHGRRPGSASIRSGRAVVGAGHPDDRAGDDRADVARASLTEHTVSYLVRNDLLVVPVPRSEDELDAWTDVLERTTDWVSELRRHHSAIRVDGSRVEVVRIDDPRRQWAAAGYDRGATRVTMAGETGFLERAFTASIR